SGRQANLLAALQQATQQRGVRPDGDLNRVAPLLNAESEMVRAAAARAAGLWRVEALRPKLLEAARADKGSEAVRQAAFDGLARLGGPPSKTPFQEHAGARPPQRIPPLAPHRPAAAHRSAAAARGGGVP